MHNMGDKPRLALMSFVGVIAKTYACEGISLKTEKRWTCTKCCQGLLVRYLSIILVSFKCCLQGRNVFYDFEMCCFSLFKLSGSSVLEVVLINTLLWLFFLFTCFWIKTCKSFKLLEKKIANINCDTFLNVPLSKARNFTLDVVKLLLRSFLRHKFGWEYLGASQQFILHLLPKEPKLLVVTQLPYSSEAYPPFNPG